jgi:hypothetical protein
VNSIENINSHNQKNSEVYSNSLNADAPQNFGAAGGIRKKGTSAMRGTNTVIGGSDFNQTQSTMHGASVYNQRSTSNHNQRPQSSFTNMPNR